MGLGWPEGVKASRKLAKANGNQGVPRSSLATFQADRVIEKPREVEFPAYAHI